MPDLAERVCTGYTSLKRTQASSYRDGLNAVLYDAQSLGKYMCGYRIRVGEDVYALHVREADSDEKMRGFHHASAG